MNIQLLAGLSFDDALYITIIPMFAFFMVYAIRWLYNLALIATTWLINAYCMFVYSVLELWLWSVDWFVDGIVSIEKKLREL